MADLDCPEMRLERIRARIEIGGLSFGTPGGGYDLQIRKPLQ